MISLINRLLWGLQARKSRKISLEEIPAFKNGRAIESFFQFDNYLAERTGTVLEPLHRLRFMEINTVVRNYDVNDVIEMGSGRTTYFFNTLLKLNVVSYEQDEKWAELILEYFKKQALPPPKILLSEVESYNGGARFSEVLDTKCDLLYIDGPYFGSGRKSCETVTGKPAYFDFETILQHHLPKVIMLEGRTDTADALLNSEYIEEYKFGGELTWHLERGKYSGSRALRRHSTFIRADLLDSKKTNQHILGHQG
jgi:hypothetical protein